MVAPPTWSLDTIQSERYRFWQPNPSISRSIVDLDRPSGWPIARIPPISTAVPPGPKCKVEEWPQGKANAAAVMMTDFKKRTARTRPVGQYRQVRPRVPHFTRGTAAALATSSVRVVPGAGVIVSCVPSKYQRLGEWRSVPEDHVDCRAW